MKSGKPDEELGRMDALAGHLQSGSIILLSESFSATNEREGSEINRQITQALIDNGVEAFSVTHLFTYASDFLGDPSTQFLRAQRLDDGRRTFQIVPGKPLQSSFGEDLYRKIFAGNGKKYDRNLLHLTAMLFSALYGLSPFGRLLRAPVKISMPAAAHGSPFSLFHGYARRLNFWAEDI